MMSVRDRDYLTAYAVGVAALLAVMVLAAGFGRSVRGDVPDCDWSPAAQQWDCPTNGDQP
jgi:hypothetical protein